MPGSIYQAFLDQLMNLREQSARERRWQGMSIPDTVALYRDMTAELGHSPNATSEVEGYAQYDAFKKPSDKAAFTFQAASPEDLARLKEKRGIDLNPRGEFNAPLPYGAPTAGQGARTSVGELHAPAPEYMTPGEIRDYGIRFGKPIIDERPAGKDINEPLDLVTDESMNRDDDVSQTGWLPADFQGMSPQAAAAIIADQLRTHRIRQMGVASPDYLATLPIY